MGWILASEVPLAHAGWSRAPAWQAVDRHATVWQMDSLCYLRLLNMHSIWWTLRLCLMWFSPLQKTNKQKSSDLPFWRFIMFIFLDTCFTLSKTLPFHLLSIFVCILCFDICLLLSPWVWKGFPPCAQCAYNSEEGTCETCRALGH